MAERMSANEPVGPDSAVDDLTHAYHYACSALGEPVNESVRADIRKSMSYITSALQKLNQHNLPVCQNDVPRQGTSTPDRHKRRKPTSIT